MEIAIGLEVDKVTEKYVQFSGKGCISISPLAKPLENDDRVEEVCTSLPNRPD